MVPVPPEVTDNAFANFNNPETKILAAEKLVVVAFVTCKFVIVPAIAFNKLAKIFVEDKFVVVAFVIVPAAVLMLARFNPVTVALLIVTLFKVFNTTKQFVGVQVGSAATGSLVWFGLKFVAALAVIIVVVNNITEKNNKEKSEFEFENILFFKGDKFMISFFAIYLLV